MRNKSCLWRNQSCSCVNTEHKDTCSHCAAFLLFTWRGNQRALVLERCEVSMSLFNCLLKITSFNEKQSWSSSWASVSGFNRILGALTLSFLLEMCCYLLLGSSLADPSVTAPPEVNKNSPRFVEGWREVSPCCKQEARSPISNELHCADPEDRWHRLLSTESHQGRELR